MSFELHFKSVAVRWFFNIFLITAAVVTVAGTAFSLIVRSLYLERVETLAEDYAYEFATLSSCTPDTFEDTAVRLSDAFLYKNKM